MQAFLSGKLNFICFFDGKKEYLKKLIIRKLHLHIDEQIKKWKTAGADFGCSTIQRIFVFLKKNNFFEKNSLFYFKRFSLTKSIWNKVQNTRKQRISRMKLKCGQIILNTKNNLI